MMLHIFNFDENVKKKKILLGYYKNQNKNFYSFNKNGENFPFQAKKISLSLPGYPSLKNQKIFNDALKIDEEDSRYFFVNIDFLKRNSFSKSVNISKLKTVSRDKKVINPYSIYIFEDYMKESYFFLKTNFFRREVFNKCIYHKKGREKFNLKCATQSKEENLFKIKFNIIFKIVLFILVCLKMGLSSILKMLWNSFFILFVIRFLFYIARNLNKFIFSKTICIGNVKENCFFKELVTFAMFCNGIIRTGNPISI
nr:hypothetical protein 1634Bnrm1_p075 [Cryptomonas sp.]